MRNLLDKLRKLCYNINVKNKRGKGMQELLAKARAKLSSLQMEDIYNGIELHGEVLGVAYCYKKVVVSYEDGTRQAFQMWE